MAENKRYRFVKDYRSGDLIWAPGQEIDVTEDYAAWLNRDVPGCLVEVDVEAERKAHEADLVAKAVAKAEADFQKAAEKEAAERAADKPPADRMVKGAPEKRADDMMKRENTPGVVDKEPKRGA